MAAAAAPAPLTGVGWAGGAEAVPPGWTAITVTAEGAPACLGKGFGHRGGGGGWYLCFSRGGAQAAEGPVVTDVLVLSERSPQPPGYSRAPEFPESRGPVSRRKRLLVRREAAAAVAVLELRLSLRGGRGPAALAWIGEMGGFSLWCRKGPVRAGAAPGPLSGGLERLSLRPPGPPPPPSEPPGISGPSAMDGIPFALHPKFGPGLSSPILAELTVKSLADIEREYSYGFLLERTAAARLPPGLQ
ncbi:multivesicular body subunit 12A isoform X3 [Corvus hawaiiensis]|uniref:multivesicular body subunit 12A isoform X3 n=1 Tax=Corvus hawaiiensis TaxID=134902 RepID=UPI0020193260|nr:multivesicular body subunit 12A isoform X3 [Corvus hawaiiensis]